MQERREPDAELVDASRHGDRAAFAQLVERYQRAVYAVSLSHVHDRALSDDITQDTFVTAWRRLGELRDPAKTSAWLCGIARNLARDARKRRRFETVEAAPDVPTHGTPFDALSDAESDRLLMLALAAIPGAYREPLVLFYFEQHSADDVARALGISAATVHQRLSRGRKHLAERMTSVVETGLSRRGPKPELVAGVLAAIAILAPASVVDARPAAKGTTMLRTPLFFVVALSTLALGTVALFSGVGDAEVVAKPVASSAKPAKPVAAPTTPLAAANARPSTPQPTPSATARAPIAAPRPQLSTSSTPQVPGCEEVVAHMTSLAVAAFDPNRTSAAKKLSAIEAGISFSMTLDCTTNSWSENMRMCLLDANDFERAKIDCTDQVAATSKEVAALPSEQKCDLLAQHVYELMHGPNGRMTQFKRTITDPRLLAKLDDHARALRTNLLKECDERPWSTELRRCVAAAKTEAAYRDCR